MMADPVTAPGLLEIDLASLAANYRYFYELTGPACCTAGVVKADGYGLGMTRIAPALEAAGCRQFFVATLDEALALRTVTAQPVAVLGGLVPGAEGEYKAHKLTPVLNSLEEIARWRPYGGGHPAIIHFDTGMNRLGLGRDETERLLADRALLDGLEITLIMSHFACADEAGHPLTPLQAERFAKIAAHFPDVRKSLANSSGICRSPAWHFDMVRPGVALYGVNPTPEKPNPMRPVVRLRARLLQVRNADAGDSVGYGASYRIEKPLRIGTVALGYADGFLRSGSNRAALYYNGRRCPVIGRVSMDLVTVDLSGCDAAPGHFMEVLGPHQDADALAAAFDTIGYEVLTSLGRRWQRAYI